MKYLVAYLASILLFASYITHTADPVLEDWQVLLLPCSHDAGGQLQFLLEKVNGNLKPIQITKIQRPVNTNFTETEIGNVYNFFIIKLSLFTDQFILNKNIIPDRTLKTLTFFPIIPPIKTNPPLFWESAQKYPQKNISDKINAQHEKLYQGAGCYIEKRDGKWLVYLKKTTGNLLKPDLVSTPSIQILLTDFPPKTHYASPIITMKTGSEQFWRLFFIDITACKDKTDWQPIDAKIFEKQVTADQIIDGHTIEKKVFNALVQYLPEAIKAADKTDQPKTPTWTVYVMPCAHDTEGIVNFLFEKGAKSGELKGILAGDKISIDPVDLRTELVEKKLGEIGFKKNEYLLNPSYRLNDDDTNTSIYFSLTAKIETKDNLGWVKNANIDQLVPENFKSRVDQKVKNGETELDNLLTLCKSIYANPIYENLEFYLKKQDGVWTIFLPPSMQPFDVIKEKNALDLAKKAVPGALYSSEIFATKYGGGRFWRITFLDGKDLTLNTLTGIPVARFTDTYADLVIDDKTLDKNIVQAIYQNIPAAILAAEKAPEKPLEKVTGEELDDATLLARLTQALLLLA